MDGSCSWYFPSHSKAEIILNCMQSQSRIYHFQDNGQWSVTMDVQIMSWAMQHPEDWQIGGKCEAYMWGSGRQGQICEGGRAAFVPTKVLSFSCSQQVGKLWIYECERGVWGIHVGERAPGTDLWRGQGSVCTHQSLILLLFTTGRQTMGEV